MIKTTPAQRRAIHRLYLRYLDGDTSYPPMTYRQFRAQLQPYFGDTCVMMPMWNMWFGIELDGHTHT